MVDLRVGVGMVDRATRSVAICSSRVLNLRRMRCCSALGVVGKVFWLSRRGIFTAILIGRASVCGLWYGGVVGGHRGAVAVIWSSSCRAGHPRIMRGSKSAVVTFGMEVALLLGYDGGAGAQGPEFCLFLGTLIALPKGLLFGSP